MYVHIYIYYLFKRLQRVILTWVKNFINIRNKDLVVTKSMSFISYCDHYTKSEADHFFNFFSNLSCISIKRHVASINCGSNVCKVKRYIYIPGLEYAH